MNYEPVIGIETHVQLKTKSKLFCACDNDARDKSPNTTICPICIGLPGALPVLNEQAIRLGLKTGLALNGEIPKRTKFDRKNYFYPDLPNGYQITQFDQPIVGKGSVEFPLDGKQVKVGITRAHLEADAGKLTHPTGADYSLVDYNRASTPLMEIVSEPDIRSSAEAKAYAQEIHNLMRYADISDADLYYGNMRFDVNISLRPVGSQDFGTRAEIKNLNSFRAVERAVEYEIKRQSKLLDTGEKIIQETRGWDDAGQKTYSQRSKEEAHDYRYFPEPDLPPVVITKEMLAEAKTTMPPLPNQVRSQLSGIGLGDKEVEVLVANIVLSQLLLEVMAAGTKATLGKRVANWLIGEVARFLSDHGEKELAVRPNQLVMLATMVEDGELSATAAKTVLAELITNAEADPIEVASRLGLLQVSDEGELERWVDEAIAAQTAAVADYHAGQARALGALVGAVMKASHGQANPGRVSALLLEKLKKASD